MKRFRFGPSLAHVIVLAVVALLTAAIVLLVSRRPAAAEPQLDYSIQLTMKGHFEERLRINGCSHLFHYSAMNLSNWQWQGNDSVRVQVVFLAEYIGRTSLFGNSEMSRSCLGKNSGAGFFELGKTYPSVGLIYTLSRWSQGWHVDKLDFQP
jgi:hypothetical protein